MVKGGLSEAQAGCTIWKDVSRETFERFVQVAYTGDYSIPNTRKRNRVAEPEKVGGDTLVHQTLLGTSEELKESEPVDVKPAEEYDSLGEPRKRVISKRSKKDKKRSKDFEEGYVDWETAFPEPVADPEHEPQPESSSLFRTKRDRYPEPPSPLSLRLFAADFHSLQYPLLAPA